jgi:hypothetical protein
MDVHPPKMPKTQLVYGEMVYWVTIVACLICMVGSVLSVAFPDNNILNPYQLFGAIFEGKSAHQIWEEVGGGYPGGHFYLSNLTKGDGFTQFGLALGCSVALWSLIVVAFVYRSEKNYLYLFLAIWVAVLVGLSMTGIISAH